MTGSISLQSLYGKHLARISLIALREGFTFPIEKLFYEIRTGTIFKNKS